MVVLVTGSEQVLRFSGGPVTLLQFRSYAADPCVSIAPVELAPQCANLS
jgi:hypothetical protein